jgi:repressor LexA
MTDPAIKLTAPQASTLAHIRDYIKTHGYSPSVADLAALAGVNQNAMGQRLAAMLKKGAIIKTPGVARTIRPAATSV